LAKAGYDRFVMHDGSFNDCEKEGVDLDIVFIDIQTALPYL
jgi:hypothetical protein